MTEPVTVIRCRSCGGNQLQAIYDDSNDKKAGRSILLWGVFGLISVFRRSREHSCFWRCQKCGNTFPMNTK